MVSLVLTEEQESFRRTARDFLDAHVVPHRAQWDRDEQVDVALVPELGRIGFLGMTIPEQYGGVPCDSITYALGMEELGRADSAVRGIVSVSLGLVAKSILSYGSESQKQQWLPGLAAGDLIGCFALTEPGTGSDAGSLTMRAVPRGDDFVLNGTKIFITNGTWADLCLVFARTGEPGPRGVTAFLVPTSSPGFTRREIKGKLGLRGQATAELSFEDVVVPRSAMLGEEGRGFRIAMSALDKGRISVGAGCVGIIQGCLDAASAYSTERTQFGRQLASFQLVAAMIADMSVDLDAARLLVWRAADLLERGEDFTAAASTAKYFASEAALRAANAAIQVFGGYGYVDEFPVQKYMRDARVMTLYEGTSQIQQLLIARAITGVNAFV